MTPLSCLKAVKRNVNGKRAAVVNPPAEIITEFVGDRSGSVYTLGDSQKLGFQKFCSDRKKDAETTGAKVTLSFTTFDNISDTWYENVDVKDLPDTFLSNDLEKWWGPRGATRLVDTMFERLTIFKGRLQASHERLKSSGAVNTKVTGIAAISTDGMDNASYLHSAVKVHKLVSDLRRMGATLLFLAANQDAIATATMFGFAQGNALTMGATPQQTQAAYRSASAAATRGASGLNTGFTQMERQVSAPVQHHTSPPAPLPVPVAGYLRARAPPSNLRMRTIHSGGGGGGGGGGRGQSGAPHTPPPPPARLATLAAAAAAVAAGPPFPGGPVPPRFRLARTTAGIHPIN
jgi:hypothetical protein